MAKKQKMPSADARCYLVHYHGKDEPIDVCEIEDRRRGCTVDGLRNAYTMDAIANRYGNLVYRKILAVDQRGLWLLVETWTKNGLDQSKDKWVLL